MVFQRLKILQYSQNSHLKKCNTLQREKIIYGMFVMSGRYASEVFYKEKRKRLLDETCIENFIENAPEKIYRKK